MYIYSEVRLYKRLDTQEGNWSSTYTTYSDAVGKNIKIGLGTKKDTFSFKINNNYNKYFMSGNIFEKGDKVEIYQTKNTTTVTSDDLLIDGVITTIINNNDTSKQLTIEGKSRTEMFLEGLTFVTMSTPLTPPEILQESLNFHNRNNQNFTITWNSNNPATKEDTTAFPTYQIETFYKSMNLTFEKYSSSEYTKDGNYYYYLDKDNTLVWNKKKSDSLGVINESKCQSVKIRDDNEDVINSVIINAGYTPKGKPIRTYYYDYASRNEHGAKWKYLTSTNTIASDLILEEQNADDEASGGNFDSNSGLFPNSYPYTTYTDSASIANDGEWEDWVKSVSLTRAKAQAKAYCQNVNQSLVKADIVLPFTTDYVIGGVYTCNFSSGNIEGIPLRVNEISYGDYTTTLYLKEDESV